MIAVTGVGVICSLGNNCEEVFSNICTFGPAGVQAVFRQAVGLSAAFRGAGAPRVAEVPLASETLLNQLKLEGGQARRVGRTSLLAIKAIQEAVADAGLAEAKLPPERIGLFGGSAMGGGELTEKIIREYQTTGRLRHPSLIPPTCCSEICSVIARTFGWRGPRVLVSTACSSSTVAMYFAQALLLSHELDAAVVFGGDPLCEVAVAGFSSLGAFLDGLSAPFSTGNAGISLGEGAAAMVLERSPHRAVKPYAWLGGVGVASECHHLTAPNPNGLGAGMVMAQAVAQAGKTPQDIQAVIAHGTGTELNDQAEARAIQKLMPHPPLVLSTKGATGHTLGAAGIVNAVLACLCFKHRAFPASPGFASPRTHPGLDVRTATVFDLDCTGILANSFAFGGSVASAALFREAPEARPVPEWGPVVLTGVGHCTPAGSQREQLERAIMEGSRHFTAHSENRSFTGRSAVGLSGLVAIPSDPKASLILRRSPGLRRMDRFAMLGYVACTEALQTARYRITDHNQNKTGIILGSSQGSRTVEAFLSTVIAKGPAAGNPSIFPNTVMNACLGYLTMDHLIRGPSAMIMQGDVASGLSLLLAAEVLARSDSGLEAMLCGGIEELSSYVEKGCLDLGLIPSGARADEGTEPLNSQARGFLLGEGSLAFLIERADAAAQRGATIEAEVAGSFQAGSGGPEPGDRLASRDSGAAQGVAEILDRAAGQFGCPDLLIGNVTGVPRQRRLILAGIQASLLREVPLYSPIRIFGNCLGAAGALGVFTALTALKHQVLPSPDQQRCSRSGSVRTVFVLSAAPSEGFAVVNVIRKPTFI